MDAPQLVMYIKLTWLLFTQIYSCINNKVSALLARYNRRHIIFIIVNFSSDELLFRCEPPSFLLLLLQLHLQFVSIPEY